MTEPNDDPTGPSAREAALREVLELISRSRDDDQAVFVAILERAARLCDAPRAFLFMVDEARAFFRLRAVLGVGAEILSSLPEDTFCIDTEDSHTARAIRECRVAHVVDMADEEAYRQKSAHRVAAVDIAEIRTLLAVPLALNGEAIGVLMLNRLEVQAFTEDQIDLVKGFAAQAVIAIENVRQFKALEALNAELEGRVEAQVAEIERMGRLKRFLPGPVADAIISSGDEAKLGSHRALIGVLFCDIRGFTAFCETAEPEETIEVLQTYHEEMGALIAAHAAGVDHRAGDGIMVIFNDPLPCDDPAGVSSLVTTLRFIG